MRFHFLNICWGAEYCRMFLDEMLPTLLSSGNLAAPELKNRSRFALYTTKADIETIREHPSFRRLHTLMEIVIIEIDGLRERLGPEASKYQLMNACHVNAILEANLADAAIVFLHPDIAVSDGMCRNLVRLAEQGKAAVMLAGSHLSRPAFLEELARRRGGDLSRIESWTIPPREMIAIALRTMNRQCRSGFWDSEEVSLFPNHLHWRVGRAGYIVRGFHLHPIMVKPAVKGVIPQRTFDEDFLERACPDLSTYHFVQDSDEMSVFSLCPEDEFVHYRLPGRYSEEALAAYLLAQTGFNVQHFSFVQKPLRFHADDLDADGGEWDRVESESGRTIDEACRLVTLNRSRGILASRWARLFASLLQARRTARAWSVIVRDGFDGILNGLNLGKDEAAAGSLRDERQRLRVHFVGSRAADFLPRYGPFQSDFEFVGYGDGAGDYGEGRHAAQVVPCMPLDRDGEATLHCGYCAYADSVFPANPRLGELYGRRDGYDYLWSDASRSLSQASVATARLDALVEAGRVPPPDFLCLDTEGTGFLVLKGAAKSLRDHIVAVCVQAEFLPLYEDQPLFSQVLDHLTAQGFHFCKFLDTVEMSFHRSPIGMRGEGFTTRGHALFLRDVPGLLALPVDDAEKCRRLLKLAAFSLLYGQFEYALKCLAAAEPLADNPLLAPSADGEARHVAFLRRLLRLYDFVPRRLPPVFSEIYTVEQSRARLLPGQPGVPPIARIARQNESLVFDRMALPSTVEIFLVQNGFGQLAQILHRRRHSL